MKIKLASGIAIGVLMTLSAVPGFTQEQQPATKVIIERSAPGPDGPPPGHPGERIHIERHAQGQGPMAPHGPNDFIFLATEMSFSGKLVKGLPYSAQAVTESTQTLSDGNRIVNKSTASIYRDSEGRTRREQSLRAIGSMKGGAGPQHVFINDPVAGTSFSLDPEARVARKLPPMRFRFEQKLPPEGGKTGATGEKSGAPGERNGQYRIEVGPDVMFEKKMTEGGVSVGWTSARNGNAKTEALGKQNIEGVEAEGTRTIVTIPAGEIGNEREIQIVSERWYSEELQTIVMTRHSDPRFGDNSYRLTNISRTEPARSLFEIPADYTVKEGPEPMKFRMRKPAQE